MYRRWKNKIFGAIVFIRNKPKLKTEAQGVYTYFYIIQNGILKIYSKFSFLAFHQILKIWQNMRLVKVRPEVKLEKNSPIS